MSRLPRIVLATLALSCGPPAPAARPVAKPTTPAPEAPRDEPPRPIVHASRAAVEAPHSGTIQMIAATPDTSAVLSIDDVGGARLWPTLDGTQEPRVVDLPRAKQLVLGRTAADFSAFVLDESGGLYIAHLDRDGRTVAHTTHGTDPAYAGIVMSSLGALAWRVDHHVLRIDGDGAVKDDLATEPQQRIVDIAVAGTRAVALLDNAGTRQARWLALQPKLAWGDWVAPPTLGEAGMSIALAPDHKHIALSVVADKVQRVLVVDDKGKEVITQDIAGTAPQIAFADDKLLAIGGSTAPSWLDISGADLKPASGPLPSSSGRRDVLVAGGGRAIWPANGELMLLTPSETKFLGYDTLSPRIAQPAADGTLVVNMNTTFHQLDANLRATTKPWLARAGAQTSDMQWLGGTDWLVESGTGSAVTELVLVDAAKGSATVVRDKLPDAHVLGFAPSTDIATLSFGSAAEVAHLDRKARTLDRVATASTATPYEQTVFVPLAPALARGMKLLHVTLRDKPTIKWLADPKALEKPAATLVLDGSYAASDAAGHVYAWHNTGKKMVLTVYTDGKQTATLPTVGPATLWPNPAGTQIAELAQNTVSLYRADGTIVWTLDLPGVQEALWLTDGMLALTHATGVARVDPATGTLTAARCGWDFGLSTKPHPFPVRFEPICMQLLR
jgi:hypothetical protein